MNGTSFKKPTTDAVMSDHLLKSMGMGREDAISKGILPERGVYFMKTGAEIAEGCLKQAAELKKKLAEVSGAPKGKQQFGADMGNVVLLPESPAAESDAAPVESYIVSAIKREICHLESIARNIDKKKKFCLYEWELSKYGL